MQGDFLRSWRPSRDEPHGLRYRLPWGRTLLAFWLIMLGPVGGSFAQPPLAYVLTFGGVGLFAVVMATGFYWGPRRAGGGGSYGGEAGDGGLVTSGGSSADGWGGGSDCGGDGGSGGD